MLITYVVDKAAVSFLHMSNKATFPAGTVITELTFEGPFIRVSSHMTPQSYFCTRTKAT